MRFNTRGSRIKVTAEVDRRLVEDVRARLAVLGLAAVTMRSIVEDGLRAALPRLEAMIEAKKMQDSANLLRRLERQIKHTNTHAAHAAQEHRA